MIRTLDLRGRRAGGERLDYRGLVPRAAFDVDAAVEAVRPLVDAVRRHGEAALIEQAARFDGIEIERVRVPEAALDAALAALDPDVRAALETSIERLRTTCRAELPSDVVTEVVPGGAVSQRQVPVGRVGLYVPAAKAPLVSSVIMNVVPAQVAGVASIALASPAQREHGGLPHPTVLAACGLLGISEVYAAGGAGAIAMFAYGYDIEERDIEDRDSEEPGSGCQPVDLVTGPANIYGVAAKRLLRGVVGIDSEAGPTEIAILADAGADAALVAADLVSQAEHDTAAASVLVTDSAELAAAVERALADQVATTKHHDRVREALSGPQSAIVLVDDLDQGLDVVNAYAAEHLELHTTDARERAARVRNAGAVFVGPNAPVSLGDYAAGSNHVLPTGACACHASGLSVRTFLKTVQVVDYSRDALAAVADTVQTLAEAEDLPAHGAAVAIRFRSP
ncbi:MAG TPA: histidinol dehydrogenase [Nocardioidaceae bacterium]|nr:histidinol dehydrogenase [Nocardioidaceae bacterium]